MGRLVRVGVVVGADESLLGIAGHWRCCLYSRSCNCKWRAGMVSMDETSRGTVNQCCYRWRVGPDCSSMLEELPEQDFQAVGERRHV